MNTLSWSDAKRRANLKLSDLRHREAQIAHQKDQLKNAIADAMVLNDRAQMKELETKYWPLHRAWREAVAARQDADKEFRQCQ